ncbi:MAG TPA: glycerate kinase, partial [Acidimicrobiia bacterium]|nr:glycerate kinase [Acidimicrobiia bacterium]
VDLVVTGEGRFDRTSLDGKVTGSVLEWVAAETMAYRAVVAGQVADGLSGGGDTDPLLDDVRVLSLVDRVWQAGEAWARAGLLVEEAAVEIGRWALERLG